MVFEEGLDKSGLPEALKEDFNQLDQLEGQYRATTIHVEAIDRKGPLCPFCDVSEDPKDMKKFVEYEKPIITLSKVILSDIVTFFYQSLLKVDVGSEMYKHEIRWPKCLDLEPKIKYIVLDYILTISITKIPSR